jgi:hypothetical protein
MPNKIIFFETNEFNGMPEEKSVALETKMANLFLQRVHESSQGSTMLVSCEVLFVVFRNGRKIDYVSHHSPGWGQGIIGDTLRMSRKNRWNHLQKQSALSVFSAITNIAGKILMDSFCFPPKEEVPKTYDEAIGYLRAKTPPFIRRIYEECSGYPKDRQHFVSLFETFMQAQEENTVFSRNIDPRSSYPAYRTNDVNAEPGALVCVCLRT